MANNFKVVISGEDKGLIKLLKNIQVEFGGIDKPVRDAGKSIKRASSESGLSEFNKRLVDSKEAAIDLKRGLEGILPPIGELAAFATVGGIADLAYKFAAAARQIQLTQKYTGLSTEAIQQWTGAATAAGVAGDTMNETLNSFSQAIEGAVYGRNTDLQALAVRMGVDLGHPGAVKGVDNVMRQIAEAISANPDEKTKKAIIHGFGLDSISAFLIDGISGLDRYQKAAKDFGLIQSPERIAQAAAFNKTILESKMAIQGLGNSIGSDLIPVFDPMLKKFNELISANRELIATNVAAYFQHLKDGFEFLAEIPENSYKAGNDIGKSATESDGVLANLPGAFNDWLHGRSPSDLAAKYKPPAMPAPVNPAYPMPGDYVGPYGGAAAAGGGTKRLEVVFKNAPSGMKVNQVGPSDRDTILKILHTMPPGVAN